MSEITASRTLNSKTFRNSDGSYNLESHCGHIHYKYGQELRDIENSLIETPFYWEMDRAGYGVRLPKTLGESIEFVVGSERLTFLPYRVAGEVLDKISGVQTGHNQITYPLIPKVLDLVLSCGRNSFRKELVIKKNLPLKADFLEAEFPINLPIEKLTSEKFQTGNIFFRKPICRSADVLGSMPVMLDFKDGVLTKKIPRDSILGATYPIRTDTTTSYYAGAGDGYVYVVATGWASARGATEGSAVDDTDPDDISCYTRENGGDYTIFRAFYPCNLAALPVSTITAASLFVHRYLTNAAGDNDAQAYSVVVETSQASTSELVVADFNNLVFTALSATVGLLAWGEHYNEHAFNATGLTKIIPGAWLKIGLLEGHDLENVAVANASTNYARGHYSEQTATDSDPYLSVTYSAPSSVTDGDLIGIAVIRKS